MKQFYPTRFVESVYHIDYQELWQENYRGLIFDIDQTLVNHGEPVTSEVKELFLKLKRIGFKVVFLSNNSQERVDAFSKPLDVPYIYLADKPNSDGFSRAINILNLDKNQIIMIGDQIFTDILGANRVGLDSILVKFIRREHEIKIGKRRRLEQLILLPYHWFKKGDVK